jgi:hypothetical protein
MRLPPQLIEQIARNLVNALAERGVLVSDHPERTMEKWAHVIAGDLRIEDEVTEEARELLLQHQARLKEADVEYHTLLAKAKAQIAAKRGYVLSTGPGRLSREKIQDLTRQLYEHALKDDDVEYFVKDQELRNAILRALELEMARDAAREEKARQKVRNIKRHIPEDSPEFHALFQQFYRELVDKGQ